MKRDLFLVTQSGGVPTYIFATIGQAEAVLDAEFWQIGTGPYRSDCGRWDGYVASGDEVSRLLGWVPEAVLDVA